MVIFELRDAAYDTAFELLDEVKHSVKKTKLTLCELENAMYDCYDASKEEYNYDPSEEIGGDEPELNLRRDREEYRHYDRHDGIREDDDMYGMRMRSGSRMRSSRRRRMR